MSQTKYSDGPEAIIHDDPEAVPEASPSTTRHAASGISSKRLGDMKASTFWLLFCLICVVVIGVTIGGAVGGFIAANKSHHPNTVTQIPTPTATNALLPKSSPSISTTRSQSAVPPFPTSDCASANGSTYNSLFLTGSEGSVPPSASLSFTKVCGVEQYGNNLALAYMTTFDACIELCASLNFWNQDKNCLGSRIC